MRESHEEGSARDGLSRRQVLRMLGTSTAVLAAGPAFLVACGDDDDDTGSGSGGTSSGGGDAGKRLAELLEIDPATAGKGKTFRMGACLALTGTGAFYGTETKRGIELAVEHIKAAGGPNFEVKIYDIKSGDAAAGKQAITELGEAKFPAKLTSYTDDLGAMLPGTKKYKIFTMDGGGGTSVYAQGQPYFWGTRAVTPNDALPGFYKWTKEAYPDAKTIGWTIWELGEPVKSIIRENLLGHIEDAGYEFNGLYEEFPIGTTDFSGVFPKIKDNEPDILMLGCFGQDPGVFLNQSLTAGLGATILGCDLTPDAIKASKGAYDKLGWTFAYDHFDAENPSNPLAKLFVEEYEAKYDASPEVQAANFYEDTLGMWDVVRRVLKKGGDITDGTQLDAAFREDLTLVSVYGGDANTVGTFTLDPKTHSVSHRTMGVFTYKDGETTPQAFFDLNGADYRKA